MMLSLFDSTLFCSELETAWIAWEGLIELQNLQIEALFEITHLDSILLIDPFFVIGQNLISCGLAQILFQRFEAHIIGNPCTIAE